MAADVLIIGAGPAGLSLACALADAGMTVRLLEQQPRAMLDDPPEDGREIALTHRARHVMQSLGLWDRLPPREIAPLREARVLDGDRSAALRFAPPDLGQAGAEPLGWLVPNHLIRRAALAAACSRPAVQLQCDARVDALSLDEARAELTLADGQRLAAPLVVAADSRLSRTRTLAGIGASMRDFGRVVIVARIAHERPNDGIAWECFRYGNTLALLPMNDGQASAVVTLPSDQAPQWLELSDADFAARVEAQSGGRLGAVRMVGARHHYPLVGVYAHRFAARRGAQLQRCLIKRGPPNHQLTLFAHHLPREEVGLFIGVDGAADIERHKPTVFFDRTREQLHVTRQIVGPPARRSTVADELFFDAFDQRLFGATTLFGDHRPEIRARQIGNFDQPPPDDLQTLRRNARIRLGHVIHQIDE